MEVIKVDHLYKAYSKDNSVLKDVSFTVYEGEFIVLLGASGCGKTTMLKMINKLIPVSSGRIYVEGKLLSDWDTIELRRAIGYVIQHIGLFPHMTIEKNLTYVLSIKGCTKEMCHARALDLVSLVGLEEKELKKYPRQLSGGQAQRIGVARALAADPDIILMDEPFGAVDEITRRYLQDEMKTIHRKLRKTIMFVTHDIEEALRLADRIILFNDGQIEQIGTPDEMIFHPKTTYVKDFFGLKGFKASLPEAKLQALYEDVLLGNKRLLDALDRL
ncbi:MAG: ABC transporter ATP-binding protein [Acholeplasmataceae bacterium]|nr:ABC transporter ATP-binding protein [Acholeplasmataceae bacterium]